MHDIKAIRDNPEAFDQGLDRRGLPAQSAALLALDEKRRKALTRLQEAQSRRNAASKDVGAAKKAKDEALAAKLMAEVASLKDQMAADQTEADEAERVLNDALAQIPNIPLPEVPDGRDETANKEVRRWGEPRAFEFEPKQHFDLGEALGLMDFETAAKVSGARFVFLKGALARMERALAAFMLDIHTSEFGYTEVNPPILVRDAAAYGTTNLPKFKDDLFQTAPNLDVILDFFYGGGHDAGAPLKFGGDRSIVDPQSTIGRMLAKDDAKTPEKRKEELKAILDELFSKYRYWLIPTAEVSLTNLAREQIIDEDKLPWRFTASTPCFRPEAGPPGRARRGMTRQHQFTKVELVSITTPEQSLAEHERMTACAETILERLGLPYRTMLLCTGDMGFASQKTYDIEVWLPGQGTYREISSCSVCGDIQSRRMDARYRAKSDGKPRYVHTLNGSGLAVGRTLIAVLENYQENDGSIVIPEALRPYMGGLERITK